MRCKMRCISVRLPEYMVNELERLAEIGEVASSSEAVRNAITKYFDRILPEKTPELLKKMGYKEHH